MTPQMRVALMRSLVQAFVQFGGVFFLTLSTVDDMRAALISASLAAFVAVGFRGVAEGQYDQVRDAAGHVQNSDVSANFQPIPPDGAIAPGAFDPNDPSLGINRR